MSFVRTLAMLAAGYAAAKGVDQFKKMGGMAGIQDALGDNDALSGMMAKMGVPGGANALQGMLGQLTGGGAAASAGLGGLMSALGGAAATGNEQTAQMMDALTGTTAATSSMEDSAKLMIRAMLQAAKADGTIDDAEKSKILEHLGDLDAEEKAFIESELAKPIDVQGLAQDTSAQMKAQVYAMSAMAVQVDTQAEASYLNSLATALGLSEAERQQIHTAMGLG